MAERTDETWHRLLEWTRSSADAERLVAQVLHAEGFSDIDPSHPLGGRDGGVDIACTRGEDTYVAAVYFPRGQRAFSEVRAKFVEDFSKVDHTQENGFVFVANQELRLAERRELSDLVDGLHCEILHLERLASVLDRPEMHKVRVQFLGIQSGHPEGSGGDGGRAKSVGIRSRAYGGRGGRGGSRGRGGRGGHARSSGDGSTAVGGDGGDVGGSDGSGGKGGPGGLERGLPELASWPTHLWGAGRGGSGAVNPEYGRRIAVLLEIHQHYFAVFPERRVTVEAGVELIDVRFVNKRLSELGETWQVAQGPQGLELPDLD